MRLNVLLHVGHEYFFTSEWVCRCARRFDRSANARLQKAHENGFSPVCVRMWPWSSHGRLNALPHRLHMHGSVCVRMCILSAPSVLYALSQYLQQNVLFMAAAHPLSSDPPPPPQWYNWCLVSPDDVEYVFEHVPHLYRTPDEPPPVDEAAAMTGLRSAVGTPTTTIADGLPSLAPCCCCGCCGGGCCKYKAGGGGGNRPYDGETADVDGESDDCDMVCECGGEAVSVSAVDGGGDQTPVRPYQLAPPPLLGPVACNTIGGLNDVTVAAGGDERNGLKAEPVPSGGDDDDDDESP